MESSTMLATWKVKLFFVGGQLAVVKSILESIATYFVPLKNN